MTEASVDTAALARAYARSLDEKLGRGDVAAAEDVTPRHPVGHQAVWAHRHVWRWTGYLALIGLVVAEVVFLAPYLDHATGALTTPAPGWLSLALGAEAISMGAFARLQRRMLIAAGRRLSTPPIVALTYAANALSVTLPGGTAISAGYVFHRLRRWGATAPAASFTVVASGLLSTLAFAALAVIGGVFAGGGDLSSYLVIGAALAVGIAAAVVRRHHSPDILLRLASRSLTRVNRVLRRDPKAGLASVQRFARELGAIKPTGRDWLLGLWFASLNWLADLGCLIACCLAVGASGFSLTLVVVAYIAGMSAASVSVVPGGFGIVDAAMIFALTSGGVATVPATAGVLLYRLISFALVVLLGWIVWAMSLAIERRRRRTGAVEVAAVAEIVEVAEVDSVVVITGVVDDGP